MIQVEEKEVIRRLHVLQGWSIRRIARERHHSRHTVRRALEDPGPPVYRRQVSRPRPVVGPFLSIIDRWLEEDQQRPPKQRHTARRIYDRLVAEYGFPGGESSIRQYVRERRPRWQEVMIPLDHDPGEAQADWGEGYFYLNNQLTKAHFLFLRMCYSQVPFVMGFPRESLEALYTGHVAAFQELGAVPRTITYDNLSAAVKRVLTGSRREEQQQFIAFRSHHLFESNFCRPGEGHEKGSVENLVGYGRRNFLVPPPRVSSWEELNEQLRQRCRAEMGRRLRDGRTVAEVWEEEKSHLLPLPARPWPCCVTRPARATLSCRVSFDSNRYSVPTAYAGRNVLVRAYVDRVEIAAGERIVACHRRSYEHGQDILDPYHYLPVLLHKPRAFHQARAVRRYPWPPAFRQALAFLEERYPDGRGVKEFLRILALKEQVGERRLNEALELAIRYRCVGVDAVRQLLHRIETTWQTPLPLENVPLGLSLRVPVRDLSQYNLLLTGT